MGSEFLALLSSGPTSRPDSGNARGETGAGSSGHSTQEHVVVSLDDRISDYIALLGEGTEEGEYCARFRGSSMPIARIPVC